jgi:hypothetical protein
VSLIIKKELKKCLYCNNDFSPIRLQKYCSTECRLKAKSQRSKEAYVSKYSLRLGTLLTCLECNDEFKKKRAKQTYCSSECRVKAKVKRHRKMYGASSTNILICPICSDVFTRKKARQVYCSSECSKIRRKEWLNSDEQRKKDNARGRKYYYWYPEKNKEKTKKWRLNNRESCNEYQILRRSFGLSKDIPLSSVPLKVKQLIALSQIEKRRIKDKKIIQHIIKGETHEAYI